MRRSKLILSLLAAIVVVPLAVAAVLPSDYTVAREVIVARPAAELSHYIADFSTRTQWIPWSVDEPMASYTVTGTAGTRGSRFAWAGEKIGAGSATLVAHRPGAVVETALAFTQPMAMRGTDTFTFETIDSVHTKVTWTNRGALPYPVGRLFGLVIDRVVGSDYERGLARLQQVTEAAAQSSVATR
jgi:hypothetical protein